jgi:hypothetical protein
MKAYVIPSLHGKSVLSIAYPQDTLDVDDIISKRIYQDKLEVFRKEALSTGNWDKHNNEVGIILSEIFGSLDEDTFVLMHSHPKHYNLNDHFETVYYAPMIEDQEYEKRKEHRLTVVNKDSRDEMSDLMDLNRDSHKYAIQNVDDTFIVDPDDFNLII